MESILTIYFFLAELNFENLFSNLTQILPYCGHGMDLLCGTSVSEAVCPEMCGMTLDCGHTCPLPCHKRSSHEKIQCPQPCQRTCPEQHPCEKKCFEDCGKCFTPMKKLLPCGHEVNNFIESIIRQLYSSILCQLQGEVNCSQNLADVDCTLKIIKVLTNCEHSVEIECGKSTEGYKCKKPCEKLLCEEGHSCKKNSSNLVDSAPSE